MTDAQRPLPWWRKYSSLDLGRVAALAYSLIGLASLSPELFISPLSARVRPLGIVGIVGLAGAIVLTFARRRLFVGEPVLVPLFMVLAGLSLNDPYATIGLAERVVPPQSLYGSTASTVVRTVLICVALPVVVVLSPTATWQSWTSPTILGTIPGILLFAALMRVLRAAVIRQTRAAERVRLLIAMGNQLLNLTDLDRVRAVTATTAQELCGIAPGTTAVLIRLRGQDVEVMEVAGADRPAVGDRLPLASSELARASAAAAMRIGALAPYVGDLWWRVAALALVNEKWLVLAGAARPVSDDVLDAFALLASQRTEGEARCRAHAELAYRAGHDSITGLLNRGEFLARLETVMRANDMQVIAVIVMDLDNFKMVNDTHGHKAGDEMLRVIAGRLGEVLGNASLSVGVAARLGGDEFAVLVGTDNGEKVIGLARTIHTNLRRPLIAANSEIPVGISVGVAYRTEATTAAKLLDDADLAMYRAKESGKNKIAEFSPTMNSVKAPTAT
jgi:diguanylate cyclase (GGDEF)-like protein